MTAAILLIMASIGVLAYSHEHRTRFLIKQITNVVVIANAMADRIKVLESELNELRSRDGVKRGDSRASV